MGDDHNNADQGQGGRFIRGQSGNPKGRPRKTNSVGSSVLKAANAKVTVTENGRRRQVRKIDVAATQLANKSASGDPRSSKMLFDMAARAEAEQEAMAPTDTPITQSDQEIVEAFLADFLKHIEENRP